MRLEDAATGAMPPGVREQLKKMETSMFAIEARIAESAEPAESAGSHAGATDGRRYVFQIDDVSHELSGSVPGEWNHRQPVSAVNEVDEEPFPNIEYLHACVAGEGVCLETPPEFLVGCSCEQAEETDADEDAGVDGRDGGGGKMDMYCTLERGCSCLHEQVQQSGGVVYDSDRRLRDTYQFGSPIYECNAACDCPGWCKNRVVQRGISTRLQVFKTFHKGWAVRPLQRIHKGSFVCEYVGEVIATDEAERRGTAYDASGFSTLFDLDSAGDEKCEYTIDATYRCGVARFFNHSCAPNMRQTSVWVDTLSLALHRIAFFATRDIEPLEELTFDYKYEEGARTLDCHCGAPNCRRWLY